MRKFFVIGCCLCLLPLCAEERSVTDAARLAQSFMTQHAAQAPARERTVSAPLRLAHTAHQANQQPAFYAFNREDGKGYVVVSADDRARDILCYAEEGTFDISSSNPAFQWWLSRYERQISALSAEITSNEEQPQPTSVTPIAPLLGDIVWDQYEPYYNYCPIDDWDNTRSLTGCVATAAAQIMRYWTYPATGKNSTAYIWYNCMDKDCNTYNQNRLSFDFSNVTFDWSNILPAYVEGQYTDLQAAAVATLMHACGMACKMQYGGDRIGGSGAWTDDMGYGLIQYLGYTFDNMLSSYDDIDEYEKAKEESMADIPSCFDVPLSDFEAAFNADLEAGRPIIMGGEDGASGHEFVCDGRDANGLFHINWGWSGDRNCYCALSALRPQGMRYNFNDNIDALVGLRPDTIHTALLRPCPQSAAVKKIIHNNQLYIVFDHGTYNAQGQLIRSIP